MTLRILIVEDDKHTRRILETLIARDPTLASYSPEIVIAEDGRRGLELLTSGSFSLVVSDLLMPRMDGFHFCRELRRHPLGAEVPLIVTSAIFKEQAAIAKLQSECKAEFFAKPFQVKELLSSIRRLVAPKGGSVAPPTPLPSTRGGALSELGASRVLLELWDQRAIGSLSLVRGKVKKEIVLLHGAPVGVHSNLRSETLGRVLVARSLISERQHREALERAQLENEKLGSVLLQVGWLTEEELFTQLAAQMRQKISSTLRWSEGEWRFTPAEPMADRLQIPLDTPRLIFSGLHKSAHLDQLMQRFAQEGGRVALTMRAERHRDSFVRTFGGEGLEQFGRRPTLDEILVERNPGPLVLQLDVLLTCGMAEIEPAGVVLRNANVARRGSDGMTLPQLAEEALKPAARSAGSSKSLFEELFGDEGSDELKLLPVPDDEQEVSGIMELPTRETANRRRVIKGSIDGLDELRREILSEYLAIHGKDFYQVLRLQRDVEPEDIAEAYAQFGKRFRLDRFAGFDLGRDYARVEEIHQIFRQAFETLSAPDRRAVYDHLLSEREPYKRASLAAELSATRALTVAVEGHLSEACRLLDEAVAADPDQADYHALLGWFTFLHETGEGPPAEEMAKAASKRAWPHLAAAFSIDPDHLDTHDFAGRIAAATCEDERARSHLERVLDTEPTRAEALAALESSLARRGDWRRLERQYRRLIARFAELRDSERATQLWWRLAELYRTHLVDRDSARLAYQTAGLLAPRDPRPREALAKLFSQDPTAWESTAAALRESWRLTPEDSDLGRSLFRLHAEGQRWDAAFAVASVLVCRDASDEESADFFHRHRPRILVRAERLVAPKLLERVRHPDDHALLSDLFGRIFALHRPTITLADLGVRAADAFPHEALPEPFKDTLAYVTETLTVPVPTVYRRADFGTDAHVGATAPPVLLAGPQALSLADPVALTFRLARALTYLFSLRAVTGAVPTAELKTRLLAAITLVSPGLPVEDPEGEIARLRSALLSADTSFTRKMKETVDALLAGSSGRLNLSLYVRGMARTADRIGLLLSGDLPTATRIVSQEGAPGAEEDLLDFVLSDEYVSARTELGLSLVV